MTPAADPTSNHHSPRGPELSGGGGGGDSPRQSKRSNPPSLWAQVVKGGEPESIHGGGHQSPPSSSSSLSSVGPSVSEQTPFSDCSSSKAAPSSSPPLPTTTMNDSEAVENSNGNNSIGVRPKKLAWNKPSNGVVAEAPSVMGDSISWPALTESTKASPKQSADFSPKLPVTDGSVSNSQGPVKTYSPRKQANTNAIPNNSTPNHTMPTRQRSIKRGGGGGTGVGPTNSNFSHHPPPPPPPPPRYSLFRLPANAYGNFIPDPSPRDPSFRGTRPAAGFVPHPHPVNDHRNFSRRGNFGSHPHGDGAYHNNYGGRRDHDRANFANARDPHMQPHRPAPLRGFARPPSNAPPFIGRPFVNHVGYQVSEYMYPLPFDSLRPGPYIGHPPPSPAVLIHVADHSLPTSLVFQIDYYFSDANLVKDEFLRSNMDEQGWVPISLIASFPRVKNLTSNIQFILSSLRASSVVEVLDDKVRKRNDWMKWVPASGRLSTEVDPVSPGNSSNNWVAASVQEMTLEEAIVDQNTITGSADANPEHAPENCSGESTSQSLPNGEVTQNTHLS